MAVGLMHNTSDRKECCRPLLDLAAVRGDAGCTGQLTRPCKGQQLMTSTRTSEPPVTPSPSPMIIAITMTADALLCARALAANGLAELLHQQQCQASGDAFTGKGFAASNVSCNPRAGSHRCDLPNHS